MKHRFIIFFITTLLAGACTQEPIPADTPRPDDVTIKLSVNALAATDPAAVNEDQKFSSLAIYLFNNDGSSTSDKSALLPSFTPVEKIDIPIETQSGSKILYLIANYAGKTLKLDDGTSITLSSTTTRNQLERLIVESNNGFLPGSLLMVAKQSIDITSGNNGSTIGVALRRLQSRIDVHVYKGADFGSSAVTLKSVTLYNQVLNSEVKFDYSAGTSQMLASPMLNTQTVTSGSTLSSYTAGTTLLPVDAQAIFYSYQNLVTVQSPLQATAPYLEIKLNANSQEYTYKGYLTDANQVINKYSLLQNNVYQVTAILGLNSKYQLNITVLPWSQTNIEYNRPLTSADFSFGAWGTSWGGINGKTMYTNVGALEDAVFQFQLKAPLGAAWTATLTNGLDFTFASSTAGTSVAAVSKGFTNASTPSLIVVRATKKWTGELRDTEFYITVEGKEIPINPLIGVQRQYAGTDTRIKIVQVASYN